jgi:hypothetical protein
MWKLAHGFYLVAPTTTKLRENTWYVHVRLGNQDEYVCLNQSRTIDVTVFVHLSIGNRCSGFRITIFDSGRGDWGGDVVQYSISMPETVEVVRQKEWIVFWFVVLSAAIYVKGGAPSLHSYSGFVLLLDL